VKKGVLLVIGCVVLVGFLVLGGVGIWFFMNRDSDGGEGGLPGGRGEVVVPEGWETYTNSNYKIELSYPGGDWVFTVAKDGSDMLALVIRLEDTSQEKMNVYGDMMTPFYDIGVTAYPNPEGLSAKNWYLDQFGESSKASAEAKIEISTVGGVAAIKYAEPTAPASGPSTAYLVAYDDWMYSFVYSAVAHQDTHEKYLADFEKILDSVKFLE